MSRNIGPTVEILLRRIRQEGAFAVDSDLATEVYSRCEQVVNTAFKRILVTTTLTVPKQKLLFSLRGEFADALSIISIAQTNRNVLQVDSLADFSAYSPTWFRDISGTRVENWLQLGRDLFILYPGLAAASTVDIIYLKLLTLRTNFAASYNTASELPDEDVEIALTLAELVLLCRFRLFATVPKRIEQMTAIMKERGI